MKFLFISFFTLLCASAAYGFDAHFYHNDGATPVQSVEGVHSIAFHTDVTDVTLPNFTVLPIANNTFTHITIRPTASSLLDDVTVADIWVNIDGGCLAVGGSRGISLVNIFSVSGAKVLQSNTARTDISHLAKGVYIVQIIHDNTSTVTKIKI